MVRGRVGNSGLELAISLAEEADAGAELRVDARRVEPRALAAR
jgi:hypothetical protein